ncbi:uncharacterized protein LOC100206251 [Hydra vulgaris]|uniref:Uncharacterized protein LOC100206251 n=1 Tax=Hydra vulgaris TaxID=6087 RepID=A0ABM4CYC4_HYDVU
MSLAPRQSITQVLTLKLFKFVDEKSPSPSSQVDKQVPLNLPLPSIGDKSIFTLNCQNFVLNSLVDNLMEDTDNIKCTTDQLNVHKEDKDCNITFFQSSSPMQDSTIDSFSCKLTDKQIQPIKTNALSSSNSIIESNTRDFSEQVAVYVPRGWNRVTEKGLINYISPNKSRITCLEDMLFYLQYDGTCKCGLKCPLQPEKAFNFDPNVMSRFSDEYDGNNLEPDCVVCKNFEELYPPACKVRNEGRGRKPGKTKSVLAEKKVNEKRKFLTSASPLSMFQTGIDAMKIASVNVVQPIKPIQEFLAQNFSENVESVKPFENSKPIISSANEISHTIQDLLSIDKDRKTNIMQTMNQKSVSNNSSHSLPIGVEMPFSTSLMGTRKRVKKQNKDDLLVSGYPTKKVFQKVLQDAVIQKASDLQLKALNQVKTQSMDTEVIPTLRSISTIQSTQNLQHHIVSHSLVSEGSLVKELQHACSQINSVDHQFLSKQNQYDFNSSKGTVPSVITNASTLSPSSTISDLTNNSSCESIVSKLIEKDSVVLKFNPEHKTLTSDLSKPSANRPLSIPKSSPPCSTLKTQENQHMYLVQLVSQNNNPIITSQAHNMTFSKPFHSSSPYQSFVSTQGQFLLVNNQSAIPSLQSQQIKTSLVSNTVANSSVVNRTLQIQGSLQTSKNQFTSSKVNMPQTLPLHYVTTVNGQSLSLSGAISYPVMQYLPKTQTSPVSYLYPTIKAGESRFMGSGSNYVRIAPATQSMTVPTTYNLFEKEKIIGQESTNATGELFEKFTAASVPVSILSDAQTFVSNIFRETEKSPTISSGKAGVLSPASPIYSGYTICNNVKINHSTSLPVFQNGETHNVKIFFQNSNCDSNKVLKKENTLTEKKSESSSKQMNVLSHETTSLTNALSSNTKASSFLNTERSKQSVHQVGDIVWTHLPGYPKWPGKVISAHTINKGNPEDETMLYVSWFGTNQIHLVYQSRLSSFKDGLDLFIKESNFDRNSIKRNNKKHLNDFERAVSEALDELQKTKVGFYEHT